MKKLQLSIAVFAVILMLQGCNDMLNNPQPSESISQEVALSDPGAVDAVRASMYDRLHGFDFQTRYMIGPDALADNTSIRGSATRFLGLNLNSDNNAQRSGLNDGTYTDVYNLIQDANLIINGIEEGVLEQGKLDRYRGEAYAFRAFAMHHLVRVLGYEPGMEVDGWTKGIIVRTEPTLDVADADERSREDVSAVYSQIKSDLQQALNLLPSYSESGPNFLNTAFAYGLKARVHLYAGEWGDAATAADNAISAAPSVTLATDESTVANMFDENGPNHPESYFTLTVNPNTESLGVNDSPVVYTSQQYVAQLPTNSLIDLYSADDHRLGWYAPCPSGISACTEVNDEGWVVTKWNNDKGQYTDDVPFMRIAEMKLIAAEAKAKDGVVADGYGDLNDLRQARGLNPVTPVTMSGFMDEIMNERRRELVVEGHRFFDLKRLGMNIPFPDGSIKMRYSDSYKILDDISPAELETNSKLEQNPGYN